MGRSAIAAHGSPPHLWIDPLVEYRDIYQTISLARPAMALANTGAAGETNHRGLCFQVELQLFSDPKKRGTSRHVASLTDSALAWLGVQVAKLDTIARQLDPLGRGIIPADPASVPELGLGDLGYGTRSRWRLTAAEWASYSGGILGHGHVPENSHYDPSGEFDFARLIEHAQAAAGNTAPARRVELRVGSTGPAVKAWQQLLNLVFGFKLATDGHFGPLTRDDTSAAEKLLGLKQDGIVDQALADKVAAIRKSQDAKQTRRPFTAPAPPSPQPIDDELERLATNLADLTRASHSRATELVASIRTR